MRSSMIGAQKSSSGVPSMMDRPSTDGQDVALSENVDTAAIAHADSSSSPPISTAARAPRLGEGASLWSSLEYGLQLPLGGG